MIVIANSGKNARKESVDPNKYLSIKEVKPCMRVPPIIKKKTGFLYFIISKLYIPTQQMLYEYVYMGHPLFIHEEFVK